jgi:hypothetical protein
LELFEDRHERVRLERWSPNTWVKLSAPGGIELLVLAGTFTEGNERFETHSWLRLPPGAALQAVAGPQECRVWIKTGHLADVRPATFLA